MASWKLTTNDRERLRQAILRHRFAENGAKLVAQHAALASKCFDKAFTKAERAQMDALPARWLPSVRAIKVQFAGRVDSLDFSGEPAYGPSLYAPKVERIWRCVPQHAVHAVILAVEASDRLCVAHEHLRQAEAKAQEDINNLSRQIEAVMGQATTSGKLIALWPEVEPFLAAMGKTSTATVPAVPIGALNKMLGLPVGAKGISA